MDKINRLILVGTLTLLLLAGCGEPDWLQEAREDNARAKREIEAAEEYFANIPRQSITFSGTGWTMNDPDVVDSLPFIRGDIPVMENVTFSWVSNPEDGQGPVCTLEYDPEVGLRNIAIQIPRSCSGLELVQVDDCQRCPRLVHAP